jgi:DNA-binding NtrC family response regulator
MISPLLLVVEDDFVLRLVVKEYFDNAGFRVRQASNGSEARESFDESVDVALLDIRLPDANGIDLLAEMKENHPRCPVIAMTAHASTEGRRDAMDSGAFEYLAKPFPLETLEKVVRAALGDSGP